MEKTFSQMTNRELFTILTGDADPIAKFHLQNVVRAYLAYSHRHPEHPEADLQTMVQEYLKGVYDEESN